MSGADSILFNLVNNEDNRVDFDLDNWITDFENGFLDYEKTNPTLQPGYWGQTSPNRPRIKELNIENDAQLNQGYRVVEFFPNRDIKEESYLFFGTPSEIKIQVAIFMNLGNLLRTADIGRFYGIPADERDAEKRYKPQVFLFFKQPSTQVPAGKKALSAQTSFTLVNETSTSITNTKLLVIANKIKTEFAPAGTRYQWEKGKKLARYYDPDKGYELKANCRSSAKAQELFTKVLALQSDEFVAKNCTFTTNLGEMEKYPETPPTVNVLGQTKSTPRLRPLAEVYFSHAECNVWANGRAITLFDATGQSPTALLR